MSETTAGRANAHVLVSEQLQKCLETGKNAVSGAKASVEKPVREVVETVTQQVRDYTEAGRETLNNAATKTHQSFNATKEMAQQLADEGKQRLGGVIGAAASYVSGGSQNDGNCQNGEGRSSNSYAARVRSVTDHCMETGKQVLHNAKSSAEAYHNAAVEAVHSKVAHGRQQVGAYATTAKSSVEPLVDSAKEVVNTSTKCISETREAIREQKEACITKLDMFRTKVRTAADRGKPHLRSIYDDGKNAVAKYDIHMIVAVFAKVIAAVLLLVKAIFEELLYFAWVKNARDYVQNCQATQKAEKLLAAANIPKNVERVPVVGHSAVAAVTSFVNEVKESMEEMTKQS
ncbi:hypothetical protein TraAM80_02734 [Trypanosoma rangeli]|uniref:Uncharacterized protein n=1 Tax=Trypanosoma rangeli TaxID=5698 RepID=A0A3R7NM04_TRYRA|nr:uncharacterized protein TraAM80_02734 [Trypanosoma rangeli]RNF08434.1 hypothetical protein TraAM80_02734 [Trypanosoma rangeli]|eukprot:RNF08434.1 hypothetical protein TraAM80_02734 [Trypanosoma rangeli]